MTDQPTTGSKNASKESSSKESSLMKIINEASERDVKIIIENYKTGQNTTGKTEDQKTKKSAVVECEAVVECGAVYLQNFLARHKCICRCYYVFNKMEYCLIWIDTVIFTLLSFILLIVWDYFKDELRDYNEQLFNRTSCFSCSDLPLSIKGFRITGIAVIFFILLVIVVKLIRMCLNKTRRMQLQNDLKLLENKVGERFFKKDSTDSTDSGCCCKPCCCPTEIVIGDLGLSFIKKRMEIQVKSDEPKSDDEQPGLLQKAQNYINENVPKLSGLDKDYESKHFLPMTIRTVTQGIFEVLRLTDNIILSAMLIVRYSGEFESSLIVTDIMSLLVNIWLITSHQNDGDFHAYRTFKRATRLAKECNALAQLKICLDTDPGEMNEIEKEKRERFRKCLKDEDWSDDILKLIEDIVVKNDSKLKSNEFKVLISEYCV